MGERSSAPSIDGEWKTSQRRGDCVSTISPRPKSFSASSRHRVYRPIPRESFPGRLSNAIFTARSWAACEVRNASDQSRRRWVPERTHPGMMLDLAAACHSEGAAPMKDYYE